MTFARATRSSLMHADCIYCGQRATTRDHVPPKLLLERPFPNNLRTVPSCFRCNNRASLDEQYFLAMLGQISSSPTITAKICDGGIIDRTLTRSPALEQRLIAALEVDGENGRVLIRPDMDRVSRVVKKIAVGLFVLHYGRVPELAAVEHVGTFPYQVSDERPWPTFIATFTERFRTKKWRVVQPHVFSYIFVRAPRSPNKICCVIDIHRTLWGVVHLPYPTSVKVRNNGQLKLFPEADDA